MIFYEYNGATFHEVLDLIVLGLIETAIIRWPTLLEEYCYYD